MLMIHACPILRWSLIATSLISCLAIGSDNLRAVDPVKLKEAQAKTKPVEKGEVPGGADQAEIQQESPPRNRDRAEPDRGGLGRDVSPEFQPPNLWRRGFFLGVQVRYLETGARITRVFPNTPAWRFGLEPGDVIVAIDGYQIGYVNGRLYDLQSELNARARRTGWVRLLMQNVRNNQLLNVDAQLAGRGSIFPRDRGLDTPLESEVDQAEAGGAEPVVPQPR